MVNLVAPLMISNWVGEKAASEISTLLAVLE